MTLIPRFAIYIVDLVQDGSDPIANALDLLQFCTKSSICQIVFPHINSTSLQSDICIFDNIAMANLHLSL